MHRYKPATTGERLCQYIHGQLENPNAWKYLRQATRPIEETDGLASYYRHHSALFLGCKLISGGKSVSEEGNIEALSTIVEGFPWSAMNSGNRLLRLLSDAVASSNREISHGNSAEMHRFARARHPNCYICGTALDFRAQNDRASYTLDHIWPSAFGGDSVPENLLPACQACNSKKGNVPTWVATDIHNLFLGISPEVQKLKDIKFTHRFALFSRAAISVAIQRNITLREAFLFIGSWAETRINDSDAIADMFNLSTHQELEEFEII